MKQLALKALIRLLLWYIDIPNSPKDEKADEFMASAWMSKGFRNYIAYREGRIIFELAGGSGITERSREDYIRYMGRRLENLTLGYTAKKAYEAAEKKKSTAPTA